MTPRFLFGVGAVASIVAVALGAVASPVFQEVDLRLYDAALRGSWVNDPPTGVATVAVDDASISLVGQWPWPRDEVARLVDTLSARGASVIGLDLLLSEPDRAGAPAHGVAGPLSPNDAILERSLGSGRVVPGHAFTFEEPGPMEGSSCVLHPVPTVAVQREGEPGPLAALFRPTGVVCTLPALSRAAGASGFLNASPDPDGVMRRVPLLVASEDQVFPALALAAVLRARKVGSIGLASAPGGDLRLSMGDRTVPLEARGTLLVRYRGAARTFARFSAADVLLGRLPMDAIQDKVVFVGVTALGLLDAVTTPLDPSYPGLEVHATVAASLLDGRFIRIPPWARGLSVLLTLLAGPAVVVLFLWRGRLTGTLVALGGMAAGWLLVVGGSVAAGVFVSPAQPTLAAGLTLLALSGLSGREERRVAGLERRRRERTHHFALQSLTALMETRDQATGRHARRTSAYVRVLAEQLRSSPRFQGYLTTERIELISQLAPLHDIGKVGVPDSVLLKPGPLTDEEMAEVRKHPEHGYETIARAERDAGLDGESADATLQIAKEMVRTHHEQWDGGGYPRGLAGEDIPIPGRIMALVDSYDAIVHSRVYRAASSHEYARTALLAGRGTRYDPDVVDAFFAVDDEFRRLALEYADEKPSVS